MFFRLLMESFVRQRRRKLLAGIAILLGTTAVTAMLALATTIGDRIHKELAVYGANIIVNPSSDLLDVKIGGVDVKPATGGSYLKESDLAKLKTIFWANNITGLSPELPFTIKPFTPNGAPIAISSVGLWFNHSFTNAIKTGAPNLHPWWKINGAWPSADNQAVIGSALARKLNLQTGDVITVPTPGFIEEVPAHAQPLAPQQLSQKLTITGIVSTGDNTDNQLLLPLSTAQTLANLPNAISRVEISARTKPEDAFARKDPDSLSPQQKEIWYCRPYANSIAYQIREAIPNSQAEQVRRVEQSEGNVLARISGLMWLISAAALIAAGFAVSAAMATAILERRAEIGLMRSLGASKGAIAFLFYSEIGLLAIFAGTLGYLIGSGLAAWLGARIFVGDGAAATTTILNPVLLPVVVALALVVSIGGSTPSIRLALRLDPSTILREEA